jgi:hypothetical protein
MRSSGGRGDLGPDCELTVILGRGLEGQWLLLVLPEEQLCGATHCKKTNYAEAIRSKYIFMGT